jgi:hypothetical protein
LGLFSTLENFAADEQVNCIGLLRTLHALFEWQREHPWVVSEPPDVGFAAGKTRAMDARLLACPKTNKGSAQSV